MAGYLLDVKLNPKAYTKDTLNKYAELLEQKMSDAFEKRENTYVFDADLANEICAQVYKSRLETAIKNGKYQFKKA
jgi:hypothetical protein